MAAQSTGESLSDDEEQDHLAELESRFQNIQKSLALDLTPDTAIQEFNDMIGETLSLFQHNEFTSPVFRFMCDDAIPRFVSIVMRRNNFDPDSAEGVHELLLRIASLAASSIGKCDTPPFVEGVARMFLLNKNFSFYSISDDMEDEDEEEDGEVIERKKPLWARAVVREFMKGHGFKLLVERLKGKAFPNAPPLSLALFRNYLYLVRRLIQLLSPEWDSLPTMIDHVVEACFNRVKSMTEEEIKTQLDDRSLNFQETASGAFSFIVEAANVPENTEKLPDLFRLEIANRLLRCQYLDKRLAGLNDIRSACKHACDLVDRRAKKDDGWSCNEYRVYYQWILDNQIIDYLFGPTFHPELAKRSSEILMFVARVQDGLPQAVVDLMWDSQVGKHESISHMVFSLFSDISFYIGYPMLAHLLSKLQVIPLSEYSVPLIQLIGYIGSVMCWSVMSPEDATHCVGPLLWTAISSRQLSSELVAVCMDSLCTALERCQAVLRERPVAATFCIDAIRSHSDSAIEASRILLKVLEYNWKDENAVPVPDADHSMNLAEARKRLHEFIFAEAKVLDAVWDNVVDFVGNHLSDSSDSPQRTQHLFALKERLDAISFFSRYGGLAVDRAFLERIWDRLLVVLPSDARDIGLRWLLDNATQPSGQQLPPLISLEDSAWLFETRMMKMGVSGLGETGFKAFEHFLRVALAGAEKAAGGKPFQPADFPGLEALWRVCLDCDSQPVSQSAIFTLVRLHAVPPVDGAPESVSLPQALLHNTMKRLKSLAESTSSSNSKSITRCVMLLQKILSDLNSVSNASAVSSSSSGQGRLCKLVAQVISRGKHDVEVYTGDSVWTLKQKIAAEIQDSPSMLRLICSGKELRPDEAALDTLLPDIKDNMAIHVAKRMGVQSPADPPSSSETKRLSLSENGNILSTILAESYFTDLFALLSLPGALAQQIWDLLMKLPTNKGQLSQLKSLDSVADRANESWLSLFDLNSTFKLFYSLQIVDSLLHSANPSTPTGESGDWNLQSWRDKFVDRGGVRFLLHALLNVDLLDESKGSKRTSCLAIMVKIISEFCLEKSPASASPDKPPPVPRLSEQALQSSAVDPNSLASRLLDIIYACAAGGAKFGSEDALPSTPAAESQVAPPTPGELLAVATLNLLTAVCVSSNSGGSLAKHPSIGKWIEMTLLSGYSDRIRQSVRICLMQIVDNLPSDSASLFVESLLPPLLQFVAQVPDLPSTPPLAFFNVCAHFVRKSPASPHILDPLAKLLVERITSHSIIELRGVPFQDFFLQGILDLLAAVIDISPSHKVSTGKDGGLVQWLFHHGLFEIATPDNNGPNCPPICKARDTRIAAFRALFEYSKAVETFEILSLCLRRLLRTRERPLKVWTYAPGFVEKAPSGIVGLKNLGATCYMNSLTQQFFMIPQFRANLLQAQEVKPENPDDPQDSLLSQMQAIMANLQESERRFYDTIPFCRVYKPQGNQPMNPGVQMDVDEFFLNLFDKLEKCTKGGPQEKILKDFFGGQFAQQIVSRECEHVSERDEDFFTLSVEVKGKRKLEESLDLFVKGDLLDGDNKYFCDKCNKRVDALKRCCLKTLPNNLFVHLKRFDFDFELLRRSKVNDYCEFPMLLNMEPYTREGLSRREHSEPAATADELKNYEYELTGIIVHSGTVDSGHYYSYIKDRMSPESKWYLFNDADVEPWDPTQMASQCFGGSDTYRGNRAIPKHYSAYMLVYSKVVPTTPDVKKPMSRADLAKAVPPALYERTWEDNNEFLTDKLLFDPDFFHFVSNIAQTQLVSATHVAPYSPELRMGKSAPFDRVRAAAELGLRFVVEILVHAKDKEPKLTEMGVILGQTLISSPQAAQWFLHQLCRTNLAWMHKVLDECPLLDVRTKFTQLIQMALVSLSSLERAFYGETVVEDIADTDDIVHDRKKEIEHHEEAIRKLLDNRARFHANARKQAEEKNKKYHEDDLQALAPDVKLNTESGTPRSIVIDFMDRLVLLLPEIHLFYRSFSEYFHIFETFAGIGPAERQYLLNRNVVVAFLQLYLGPDSPDWTGPKRQSYNLGRSELQAVENMKHALGTVWTVLRHCKTPLQMQDAAAPDSPYAGSQEGGLFELPQAVVPLFLSPQCVYRLVEDGANPDAVNALFCHWAFENMPLSEELIRTLTTEIKNLNADSLSPLLVCLSALLNLKDSCSTQRVTFIVSNFLEAVLEGKEDKSCTMVCTKFLVDMAEEMPLVRELLFSSRSSWLKPFIFHPSDAVRTITEQLVLTICRPSHAYSAVFYEKLLSSEQLFNASGPEALKAAAAKRAALFGSPAEDSAVKMQQIFEDLLSFLPDVKRFSHLGKKPADNALAHADFWGTRQWGRLMNFAFGTEHSPAFLPHVPVLLEAIAFCEGDRQIQYDHSKVQLLLLFDKLTASSAEVCDAVISAFSNPQLRVHFDRLIEYAFWADTANVALAEFNEVNMTCWFRVMERLSRLSKDFMHAVLTTRVWTWLVKHVIIHESQYHNAAEAMISLATYGSSVDVNWRRGQLISLIPLIVARAPAPIVHRQFKMFMAFLVDKEDYLQMCEHKGLNSIASAIGIHAANSHSKPLPEPHSALAFVILEKALHAWAPAFLTPDVPEAVRERALAYRTSTLLPQLNHSQTCLSVVVSLCFASAEVNADPDFVKLLLSIVNLLMVIEPNKCSEDVVSGLRKYFTEMANRAAAAAATDGMDIDDPKTPTSRVQTALLFSRILPISIKRHIVAASSATPSSDDPTNSWLPVFDLACQFLSKWLIPECEMNDATTFVDAMLQFFDEGRFPPMFSQSTHALRLIGDVFLERISSSPSLVLLARKLTKVFGASDKKESLKQIIDQALVSSRDQPHLKPQFIDLIEVVLDLSPESSSDLLSDDLKTFVRSASLPADAPEPLQARFKAVADKM